jgi:hypothetical protein
MEIHLPRVARMRNIESNRSILRSESLNTGRLGTALVTELSDSLIIRCRDSLFHSILNPGPAGKN